MKWLRPGRATGEPLRIEILVRRIDVAAAVSVLVHVLLYLFAGPRELPMTPPGQAPMQVVIVNPDEIMPPEPEPPRPIEKAAPTPIERVAPPKPVVRPAPPKQQPTPTIAAAEDLPTPTPAPVPAAPQVDMMAMIESRRAQRRAAESARAGASNGPPSEDAATRNLRTLNGGEGVGGVFQILEKGLRTGRFAFNGWKPDAHRQWRDVIEVDAGVGGDIEVAMVRRMIELIRSHYSGDFQWDSHRLARVVTLSARPEDQSGLEDFMMKEFFGPQGRAPPRG